MNEGFDKVKYYDIQLWNSGLQIAVVKCYNAKSFRIESLDFPSRNFTNNNGNIAFTSKSDVDQYIRKQLNAFIKAWQKNFFIDRAEPGVKYMNVSVGANHWGFGTFSISVTKEHKEPYISLMTRKPVDLKKHPDAFTMVPDEWVIDTKRSGMDRVKASFMEMIDRGIVQ